MKKGYIIIETCEDYEQVLCLEIRDNLPSEGILTWPNQGLERHVFPDRKQARAAINRTHHYAKAFGCNNRPERVFCKIVPVTLP